MHADHPAIRAALAGKPLKPRPYTPPEREVQRAVKAWLEARGAVCVRVNSALLPRADGGRMRANSEAGCSDLLCCYPCPCGSSVFLSVEVKRQGGKLTPAQEAFLERVRRAGGIGLCVSSVDELEAGLRTAGLLEG